MSCSIEVHAIYLVGLGTRLAIFWKEYCCTNVKEILISATIG